MNNPRHDAMRSMSWKDSSCFFCFCWLSWRPVRFQAGPPAPEGALGSVLSVVWHRPQLGGGGRWRRFFGVPEGESQNRARIAGEWGKREGCLEGRREGRGILRAALARLGWPHGAELGGRQGARYHFMHA